MNKIFKNTAVKFLRDQKIDSMMGRINGWKNFLITNHSTMRQWSNKWKRDIKNKEVILRVIVIKKWKHLVINGIKLSAKIQKTTVIQWKRWKVAIKMKRVSWSRKWMNGYLKSLRIQINYWIFARWNTTCPNKSSNYDFM